MAVTPPRGRESGRAPPRLVWSDKVGERAEASGGRRDCWVDASLCARGCAEPPKGGRSCNEAVGREVTVAGAKAAGATAGVLWARVKRSRKSSVSMRGWAWNMGVARAGGGQVPGGAGGEWWQGNGLRWGMAGKPSCGADVKKGGRRGMM
jgi:hypothetical protein